MKNPNWTRDELILALELYFRVNPLNTSEANPDIVAVSDLLNILPIHPERENAEKFRNPNGVYMKLCNFLRLDPSYEGEGLKAGSRLDEAVWDEFAGDRQRLRDVAARIRDAGEYFKAEGVPAITESDDDLDEAPEGRLLTRMHRVRERNRELVDKKKNYVLKQTGRLGCEVCGFDFRRQFGALGEGFIECHHTKPLSTVNFGDKTKLADLALVCSNCHRMLHRGRPWPSVDDLRSLIAKNGAFAAVG